MGSQNRSCRRQAHVDAIRTESSTPLINSHSLETALDRIGRERRSHTMAPSTRILRPSSTLKAKLFASATAPIDSKREISVRDDQHRENDDAPIIVKVRYDPNAGDRPSKDLVRLAIDRKLAQQSDRRINQESIVIDFLGQHVHLPRTKSGPVSIKQQQHNQPYRADLPSRRVPRLPQPSQPRFHMPPEDPRRVYPTAPLLSVSPPQGFLQPFSRVAHHRSVQARQPPANEQQAERMIKQREPSGHKKSASTNVAVSTGRLSCAQVSLVHSLFFNLRKNLSVNVVCSFRIQSLQIT